MLSLRKTVLGFGGPRLLDGVDLEIRTGERICLLGRNGAGKSSLLKIIAGELAAEAGERVVRDDVRIAFLNQETDHALTGSVESVVRQALRDLVIEDWEADARVDRALNALALDGTVDAGTLSVGMRRRVILGRCLAQEPDLLILDEPTNHLDLEAIAWLESFLPRFRGAVLFTTHDRAFMQKLATRILDLERGILTSWDCDYTTYLQRKEAWLEGEAVQAAAFDKKLAKEEAWIRQGVRARRTRNEGRVRALQSMREERRGRRQRAGDVKLEIEEAERSGAKVIAAAAISYSYGNHAVVDGFSALIRRGDRIGIVGPNGAGKTTLIKLLLGLLKPDCGQLAHGTNLEIAYFDQTREQLPPESPVVDCIADGAVEFDLRGRRRHVIGYLRDFLFTADRARSPVKSLSGGERNRLLLARLFTRPFNLLVMDEPTNDLDLETLELLEERILDYQGTLLLVSHDRAFLNNVATALFVLDGSGKVEWVDGGYDDYLAMRAPPPSANTAGKVLTKTQPSAMPAVSKRRGSKARSLSNRERHELEALPAQIEGLENELEALARRFADPTRNAEGAFDPAAMQRRIHEIETETARKYARWEDLEALREKSGAG